MSNLRIAIDASRTTVTRPTGTEHYALALLRAIIHQNKNHQLDLYFRDTPPPDLFPESDRVTHHSIPFKRAWTHLRLAAALWHTRPDITFVPAHTLPFAFPGASLVTVHDLGFKYFPQAHRLHSRLYLDWTTRYSAKRAALVLADSHATANDLTRFYSISAEKIRVIYPGVDAPQIANTDIYKKYTLPQRYFLFIGTLQPRKNIKRLVQAYRIYRTRSSDPAGLVLAGGKGWLYDETWTANTEGLILTGYIDETDKGALYANALALTFPSLYEGFGFPVIEAMHCGTSVIASNTSSLPELVGSAGLLVAPLDTNAIADAMYRMESDEALRHDLRERGYQQAQQFTWAQAAAQTIAALEEAAIR